MARRSIGLALLAGLVILTGAAAGGGKTTKVSVGPDGSSRTATATGRH